ncbi:MAG TPA: PIG-L family deacetylase [Euzebyales bacterium]|nr:PIG-L family deacetylase [Euzebyales bacterium]
MSRRLLGVFAHPDDESFGPAGTLAVHSAAGVDVHIVTMTDGAAGAPAAGFPDGDALAEVRREELRAAAKQLGATLHHLSYRDSGYTGDPRNDDPQAFINVDPQDPTGVLVGLLREIRPDVVVTHDEQGGYHHPDHIRCHVVVRAAFEAAGDPARFPDRGVPFRSARLYSETRSNRWIKVLTRAMRLVGRDPTRVGVNADVDLTRVGMDPARITTRIDVRRGWPAKVAAAACHVSQRGGTGPMSRVPPQLMARIAPYELFIREEPAPWPGLRERSLFD